MAFLLVAVKIARPGRRRRLRLVSSVIHADVLARILYHILWFCEEIFQLIVDFCHFLQKWALNSQKTELLFDSNSGPSKIARGNSFCLVSGKPLLQHLKL
jgi:hypothetical protein